MVVDLCIYVLCLYLIRRSRPVRIPGVGVVQVEVESSIYIKKLKKTSLAVQYLFI
jgi:hypothetical protein